MVISVLSILPHLIQPCTSNNQRRVDFNPIRTEIRVLEKLFKRLKISLNSHIWQIRHHVTYNLVSSIFSNSECFFHWLNSMTSIGVSRNVLINTLNTNFKSGTPVRKHIWNMSFLTEIGSRFNSYSDGFGLALFRKLYCFLVIWRNVSTECIMQVSDEIVSVLLI